MSRKQYVCNKHNWCSHQSALVAGSRTNSVQAGCSGISSFTWRCAVLPWPARPRRRLARTATTPFYQHQPPRGTASQIIDSRQPGLCSCSSTHLEQAANWCRCCKFSVNLSSTIKTFSSPSIISWYNLLTVTSPSQWSLQWLCHLGHFKNWLIDWLIDPTTTTSKIQPRYVKTLQELLCKFIIANSSHGKFNTRHRWLRYYKYGFCSKFHTLSSSAKILKIGQDFTK